MVFLYAPAQTVQHVDTVLKPPQVPGHGPMDGQVHPWREIWKTQSAASMVTKRRPSAAWVAGLRSNGPETNPLCWILKISCHITSQYTICHIIYYHALSCHVIYIYIIYIIVWYFTVLSGEILNQIDHEINYEVKYHTMIVIFNGTINMIANTFDIILDLVWNILSGIDLNSISNRTLGYIGYLADKLYTVSSLSSNTVWNSTNSPVFHEISTWILNVFSIYQYIMHYV